MIVGIFVALLMILLCLLYENINEYLIYKRANVHPLNNKKQKNKK